MWKDQSNKIKKVKKTLKKTRIWKRKLDNCFNFWVGITWKLQDIRRFTFSFNSFSASTLFDLISAFLLLRLLQLLCLVSGLNVVRFFLRGVNYNLLLCGEIDPGRRRRRRRRRSLSADTWWIQHLSQMQSLMKWEREKKKKKKRELHI